MQQSHRWDNQASSRSASQSRQQMAFNISSIGRISRNSSLLLVALSVSAVDDKIWKAERRDKTLAIAMTEHRKHAYISKK
jgi:hypothetical protein